MYLLTECFAMKARAGPYGSYDKCALFHESLYFPNKFCSVRIADLSLE